MLDYFMTWMKCKLGKEDGQTMAEYGLILVLIAVVVMVALSPLGDAIAGVFEQITEQFGGGEEETIINTIKYFA